MALVTMTANVPFYYSQDGVTKRMVEAGDAWQFHDHHVQGLVHAGLLKPEPQDADGWLADGRPSSIPEIETAANDEAIETTVIAGAPEATVVKRKYVRRT